VKQETSISLQAGCNLPWHKSLMLLTQQRERRCSAVILHSEFDAACSSWTTKNALREDSGVGRLSLPWEPSLALPREGHVSKWVSQGQWDPTAHPGTEPRNWDSAL